MTASASAIPLIRYPRFNRLYQCLEACDTMTARLSEPQCMALEGGTGAGKTRLTLAYVSAFPRRHTRNGTHIPVFYVMIPSPATVKSVAATMLEELGDPMAHKGTQWSMDARLVQYLRSCGLRLVILDDFHHLIDRDTDRILETVSDWLKVLIKRSGIPFVVVGIEGKVERILRSNPQLSRLFTLRETLRPFDWDSQQADFDTFIACVEETVKRPLTPAVPRPEFLYRIHFATDGVVGHVMTLFNYAAVRAGDKAAIDLSDLSDTFRLHLGHQHGRPNPFEAPPSRAFTPPVSHQPSSAIISGKVPRTPRATLRAR